MKSFESCSRARPHRFVGVALLLGLCWSKALSAQQTTIRAGSGGAAPIFTEISRAGGVAGSPFASDFWLMGGGGGFAYFAPGPKQHQWGWIDTATGETTLVDQLGDGAGQYHNVKLATGTPRRGLHYVVHDGRLSVLLGGNYRSGRLMLGRPLGARTNRDGTVRLAIMAPAVDSGAKLTLVSVRTNGTLLAVRAQHSFGSDEWEPWHATFGVDRLYVANMRSPYQISAFDFAGALRSNWTSNAGWVRSTYDEHGRPDTMILGMHELGSVLLVVSAVRKQGAPAVYGTLQRFEESNSFVLEVRDVRTGTVLSVSRHAKPPFYGSVSEDVVYRFEYDPRLDGAPIVVFLRVKVQR